MGYGDTFDGGKCECGSEEILVPFTICESCAKKLWERFLDFLKGE